MNRTIVHPRPISIGLAVAILAAFPLSPLPLAADEAHGQHIMVAPEDLVWTAGPASLPSGAEVVLIEGNPAEAGPLTLRLKFPAGYEIPAHSHPAIEHITVLSGVFHAGMGDTLDTANGTAMPAGGFVVMPIGHNHFAWTEEETVVQLHSVGPWGITYVDPADDPRTN
jgi:quercetin dioxygenase-like cupin family protein